MWRPWIWIKNVFSVYIKAVMNDRNFDEILGKSDKATWEAFILVDNNLKMPIHRQLVERMLQAYVRNGCCMLLKIHFILTCTWKFTSFLHGWVKSNISREVFIQWLWASLNTWFYSSTVMRKSNLCWVCIQWTLEISVTRMCKVLWGHLCIAEILPLKMAFAYKGRLLPAA